MGYKSAGKMRYCYNETTTDKGCDMKRTKGFSFKPFEYLLPKYLLMCFRIKTEHLIKI